MGGAIQRSELIEEDVIMRAAYVLAICAMATIGGAAKAQEVDWKKVDEAIGRSAAVSGDVHRYGFPRSDLTVTLDGVTIRPALALGGWTAFKPAHGGAMIMGDLVLLETEINPVMSRLIENGGEIISVPYPPRAGPPHAFFCARGRLGPPGQAPAPIPPCPRPKNAPAGPP